MVQANSTVHHLSKDYMYMYNQPGGNKIAHLFSNHLDKRVSSTTFNITIREGLFKWQKVRSNLLALLIPDQNSDCKRTFPVLSARSLACLSVTVGSCIRKSQSECLHMCANIHYNLTDAAFRSPRSNFHVLQNNWPSQDHHRFSAQGVGRAVCAVTLDVDKIAAIGRSWSHSRRHRWPSR